MAAAASSAAESKKKADEAVEKGKAKMKRGLFSKPDFEGALEYFSTAAKLYRSAGKEYTRQQVEAMKNAATCHRELESHSLAGKMLEEAALALMLWRSPDMKPDDEKKLEGEAAMLYGDAANSFRLGENADRAILCLTRAGEAQLRKDPDGAVRSFKDAIALVFELERVTQSMDKVQNVLSLMVKAGRVAEALEVYRRLVEHYAKIAPSFFNILCRLGLSVVVLRFHLNQYEEAAADFDRLCAVDGFEASDEGSAAADLIDALKKNSAEDLQDTIKRQVFRFLDTEVARLALRLQFSEGAAAAADKLSAKEQVKDGENGPWT